MPGSTHHYAKFSPTRLARSFATAGYFSRNLRAIRALIDCEVVINGQAAVAPWKYYDLGHGYCSYDFFDQCPYRMACARCDFYVPQHSTHAQLLEGKANLLRMTPTLTLTDEEQAAIEDGIAAYECLLERLALLPTPDRGE